MRIYSSLDELPATMPVFPLTGAVLLPRGQLPLNIFEPRYLAMADAALSGARFIGMIQHQHVPVAIGLLGMDHRNVRAMRGHRCQLLSGEGAIDEPDIGIVFRQIRPDYSAYVGDLVADSTSDFPRERLIGALKDYLAHRDLKADWRSVMSAPPETLVNALAMLCPFGPAEKQALIEANSWNDRVDTLVTLLEMSASPGPGNASLH